MTSDKAKGATSTRSPVLISGSSLSKTVKAASNVRVSIMEQKKSEVEAVLFGEQVSDDTVERGGQDCVSLFVFGKLPRDQCLVIPAFYLD